MFGAKRPFKCHACNGAITKPPEEDEHVCKPSYIKRRPKNSKSDKEPYKCEQCDKSYSRQIAIKRKLQNCKNLKDLKCVEIEIDALQK